MNARYRFAPALERTLNWTLTIKELYYLRGAFDRRPTFYSLRVGGKEGYFAWGKERYFECT
ncbi:MAG TPA: hypothetical protein DCR93_23735 [Cytophagales bacterium]|nr:hypothetical protein [Cytophagales bacterium]HAP62378.1 hypothetical protein [Cytophagales bacterium]